MVELLCESIRKCGVDIRAKMYSNIVLGGGGTMLAGMADRLEKELRTHAQASGYQISIKAVPERIYSAWLGASLFSGLLSFDWVSKEEYDESGPSIINRNTMGLNW